MKHRIWILLAIFCAISSPALAHERSSDDIEIKSQFVGDISQEQLARGTPGNGVLFYYRAERGDQRPSLAVRLHKDPTSDVAVAEVYETPPAKDYIPFTTTGTKVSFDLPLAPAITIKALGGWWVRDGLVNYNLDIQVNGPVNAMWGGDYDPSRGPGSWTALVRPNQPAVNITVRDPTHEGLPKWELRQLLPDFPGSSYYRTNYAERKCITPLRVDTGPSPLWPFVTQSGSYQQASGVFSPPIVVDWAQGRITQFSELVTVRNQNCSYALFSIPRFEVGQANHPDFETPFAFYDLSGQGKGMPNLIMRTEHYPASDPWSDAIDWRAQQGRLAPRDFETVRYSWRNAVGDKLWDYKIETLGFYPYTSTTTIGDGMASIDAPSYEQFPRWVTERSWPVVTFIDTEGRSYPSNEGIYDWSPRDAGLGYLFGWQAPPDPKAFTNIYAGFRGEYRMRTSQLPLLYLSRIDNRLHLKGAEGGLWNLGGGYFLRELHLGDSAFIDGWVRERGEATTADDEPLTGTPEEALYALDGYLIYDGPVGAQIHQADYQPSSGELLPPVDQASWRAQQQQIASYTSQKRDPNNLKSWLQAFPGPAMAITGGRISALRATERGFRFVLHLESGFNGQGTNLFDTTALQPGDYAVTYDGTFSVVPLTPPGITGALAGQAFTQYEHGIVGVALKNTGQSDVLSATLELWGAPAQGQARLIDTQIVALPAQASLTRSLDWAPLRPGTWTLTPTLRLDDQRALALTPSHMVVSPAPVVDTLSLISMSVPPALLPFIGLVLIIFAAIGAWTFGLVGTAAQGDVHDEIE